MKLKSPIKKICNFTYTKIKKGYNFIKNKKLYLFGFLYLGITYKESILMGISDSYRVNECYKTLEKRFAFSNKLEKNLNYPKTEHDFCTVYPTNLYDAIKLVEISNHYKVPIMNDTNDYQNILKEPHYRIDFSKFNQIKDFNEKRKIITVEPGVKVSELLSYLAERGYTLSKLDHLTHSNLLISDLVFNNYYAYNQGKFIDRQIHEITVIIPRNQRPTPISQNDDLTLTGLNLMTLFLRSNSTLGLITELKLKVKPLERFRYISIKNVENNPEESFNFIHELHNEKKDLGVKDIILIDKNGIIDIFLKIKEKNYNKCEALLQREKIRYTVTNTIQIDQDNTDILRKLKIILDKDNILPFIKKIKKYAEENNVDIETRCAFEDNEIEIVIKTEDDIPSIAKGYDLINKIHSRVTKLSGNIFSI